MDSFGYGGSVPQNKQVPGGFGIKNARFQDRQSISNHPKGYRNAQLPHYTAKANHRLIGIEKQRNVRAINQRSEKLRRSFTRETLNLTRKALSGVLTSIGSISQSMGGLLSNLGGKLVSRKVQQPRLMNASLMSSEAANVPATTPHDPSTRNSPSNNLKAFFRPPPIYEPNDPYDIANHRTKMPRKTESIQTDFAAPAPVPREMDLLESRKPSISAGDRSEDKSFADSSIIAGSSDADSYQKDLQIFRRLYGALNEGTDSQPFAPSTRPRKSRLQAMMQKRNDSRVASIMARERDTDLLKDLEESVYRKVKEAIQEEQGRKDARALFSNAPETEPDNERGASIFGGSSDAATSIFAKAPPRITVSAPDEERSRAQEIQLRETVDAVGIGTEPNIELMIEESKSKPDVLTSPLPASKPGTVSIFNMSPSAGLLSTTAKPGVKPLGNTSSNTTSPSLFDKTSAPVVKPVSLFGAEGPQTQPTSSIFGGAPAASLTLKTTNTGLATATVQDAGKVEPKSIFGSSVIPVAEETKNITVTSEKPASLEEPTIVAVVEKPGSSEAPSIFAANTSLNPVSVKDSCLFGSTTVSQETGPVSIFGDAGNSLTAMAKPANNLFGDNSAAKDSKSLFGNAGGAAPSGGTAMSMFASSSATTTTNSFFGSAASNTGGFGGVESSPDKTSLVFGGGEKPAAAPSIFGTLPPSNPTSIFGAPVKADGPSLFGGVPKVETNIGNNIGVMGSQSSTGPLSQGGHQGTGSSFWGSQGGSQGGGFGDSSSNKRGMFGGSSDSVLQRSPLLAGGMVTGMNSMNQSGIGMGSMFGSGAGDTNGPSQTPQRNTTFGNFQNEDQERLTGTIQGSSKRVRIKRRNG